MVFGLSIGQQASIAHAFSCLPARCLPVWKRYNPKTFSSSFTSSFRLMSDRLSLFLMVYLGFRTCPLLPDCPDVRMRNDQNLIGSGSCGQRSISRSSFSISQFSSLMVRGEKQYRNNRPKAAETRKNIKHVQILLETPNLETVWVWKWTRNQFQKRKYEIRYNKQGRDRVNTFIMINGLDTWSV